MSRYLITGGAGFIGSSIAEKLINDGHYVRVLDNFFSGKEENLAFAKGLGKDKFELVRGDIRDKNTCDLACKGMDYVLHQAALRSVPKSMADPESYNDVNINGTLFMLQAASRHKVKRFVFASSSSIYGDTDQFPEKEEHLPLLISPYALSKLTGEYYCRIFSEFFGVETACLRYFNVFGPKQALDDEYAVVVPKFIHCIMNDQPPPIFGNGKQSRDFTYIDNVVSANILALTAKNVSGRIFNIACNDKHSILEIAYNVGKVLRLKPKFIFEPNRAGDVRHTLADITLAKMYFGYKPLINFEDGMEKTVEYFREYYA